VNLDDLGAVHALRDLVSVDAALAAAVEPAAAATKPAVPTTAAAARVAATATTAAVARVAATAARVTATATMVAATVVTAVHLLALLFLCMHDAIQLAINSNN
jgi:hypothetical protein